MDTLLLTSGVDWDRPWVYHDDDTSHQLLLLQQGSGDDRDYVQGLSLLSTQLSKYHQEVVGGEHSTGGGGGGGGGEW